MLEEVIIVFGHAWNDLLTVVQIEQLKCQKVTILGERTSAASSSLFWCVISLGLICRRCEACVHSSHVSSGHVGREVHSHHLWRHLHRHLRGLTLSWHLSLSLHHSLILNELLVLMDCLLLHIDDLLLVQLLLLSVHVAWRCLTWRWEHRIGHLWHTLPRHLRCVLLIGACAELLLSFGSYKFSFRIFLGFVSGIILSSILRI